jgi:two-component system OmpR family response regulator
MTLKRILHIDDDEYIRSIVKLALEVVGGFKLLQFADGSTAIKAIAKFSPDLLLLDVMMPGMSGNQVWKALRDDPSIEPIPVIFMTAKVFMTAKAEEKFSERMVANGALSVITKPFDPLKLADEITAIWEGKQG